MSKEEKEAINRTVLKRYLNNEGDETDRRKITKWFSSSKSLKILESESFQFWKNIPDEPETEDYDEERVLDRLNHLLRLEDADLARAKDKKLRWFRYVVRIAASLFLPLAVVSYLLWSGFFNNAQETAYASLYSPLGARTNFHLPDGSEGWLNGGSTLYFPATFSGRYREVRLEGEAYFDVISNAKKPFVVNTDRIKAVALGTAFNVDAYKDDPVSKVTLASGKLELFDAKDQGMQNVLGELDAGFQFTYFKDLNSHLIKDADVMKATAWKEGKLVFRDDPMEEVVSRLDRWYNVDIEIENEKLKKETYRFTFQDKTLDEVLKLIKLTDSNIEIRELEQENRQDGAFGKRKFIFSLK
jgi:ferric-dicitrate binding protein FerR (iron transport regulator)